MPTDRITKHNKSHITTPYSVRFTNEEMDAIERIIEIGGYANKAEAIKAMLKPTLTASVTAIQTGSVMKASAVLTKEQYNFAEKMVTFARATDPTEEFEFEPQLA